MLSSEFRKGIQTQLTPLYRYALKTTGDSDQAKDLVQETLFKAYSNKNKFQLGTNLSGWLIAIMKNSFINHYRKNKKRKEFYDYEFTGGLPDVSAGKDNDIIESMNLKEIYSEIEQLDDNFRTPFILFVRGFKYREISERLNVPLGTIKNRIFIARKILKTRLINHKS